MQNWKQERDQIAGLGNGCIGTFRCTAGVLQYPQLLEVYYDKKLTS